MTDWNEPLLRPEPSMEERAQALLEAVSAVLDENDAPGNPGPHLPAKWRVPLVRAANDYRRGLLLRAK